MKSLIDRLSKEEKSSLLGESIDQLSESLRKIVDPQEGEDFLYSDFQDFKRGLDRFFNQTFCQQSGSSKRTDWYLHFGLIKNIDPIEISEKISDPDLRELLLKAHSFYRNLNEFEETLPKELSPAEMESLRAYCRQNIQPFQNLFEGFLEGLIISGTEGEGISKSHSTQNALARLGLDVTREPRKSLLLIATRGAQVPALPPLREKR